MHLRFQSRGFPSSYTLQCPWEVITTDTYIYKTFQRQDETDSKNEWGQKVVASVLFSVYLLHDK